MIGKKSILGLCLLCALMVSAVAAQSASAINGTTLQTCKPVAAGTGNFKLAHCRSVDAGVGDFKHVEVAENTTTEVKGTTKDTAGANVVSKLNSTQSGIGVEIQSSLAHLEEGTCTNKLEPSGEHYYHCEGKINFTGASITAPAGKGCAVKGGAIKTNKITTTSTGQGDSVLSTPAAGEVFAEFEVEKCEGNEAIKALNGLYQVTGSATCVPEGATLNCSEATITAKNSLKLRGQKAGFESSFTLEGKDPPEGTYTPLSVTTVVT